MAGTFSAVDLSRLPAPQVIEVLDYEVILSNILEDFQARLQASGQTFSAFVESDPVYKLAEAVAYRELLLRQRVNNAAHAVMLSSATGSDLDQIAGNYNVSRLVVVRGNPDVIPPTQDVMESDDELRRRVLLSLEGYTTAGSIASYIFHALSASGDCLDVSVANPPIVPGTVSVAVLSRTGDGSAPAETIAAVEAALNAEEVRPLCDTVAVNSCEVVEYTIAAVLTTYTGAGREQALASAQTAVQLYANERHRLGLDVTRAGVIAALFQHGVQNVELNQPMFDVLIGWNQVSQCTDITVTYGGISE